MGGLMETDFKYSLYWSAESFATRWTEKCVRVNQSKPLTLTFIKNWMIRLGGTDELHAYRSVFFYVMCLGHC